jgi:hypothetical protein
VIGKFDMGNRGKAEHYFNLYCSDKIKKIHFEYDDKIDELKASEEGSGINYEARFRLHSQRWEKILEVKKIGFLKMLEMYGLALEENSINEFCEKLEKYCDELLKGLKHIYADFEFNYALVEEEWNRLNTSVRNELTLHLIEQELGVNTEVLTPVSQTIANFYGDFTGAFQQNGTQNTQTVSISENSKFAGAISELLQLVRTSSLNPHDKDDAIEVIERLPKLAQDKQNPEALERAEKRLSSLETILSKGGSILEMARPALKIVADWFQV